MMIYIYVYDYICIWWYIYIYMCVYMYMIVYIYDYIYMIIYAYKLTCTVSQDRSNIFSFKFLSRASHSTRLRVNKARHLFSAPRSFLMIFENTHWVCQIRSKTAWLCKKILDRSWPPRSELFCPSCRKDPWSHFTLFWLEKTGEARDWKIENMVPWFRFGFGFGFRCFPFASVFAGWVQGMEHKWQINRGKWKQKEKNENQKRKKWILEMENKVTTKI